MTRFWEVFRFEVGYQTARISTRIYFGIFLAFAAALQYAIFIDARNDGYFFNAPIVTGLITIVTCMPSLLVTAGVAGDAATRDGHLRLDSLLYTTPLRKASYLGGRFLGAFVVTALLLLAVPLVLLAATRLPGMGPEVLGPFRAESYLMSYFFLAVPNAFVTTAVLFALAVLTKRAITAYAGAAFFFFSAFFCQGFIAGRLNEYVLARVADPLGYSALLAVWTSYNPLQKNTNLIGMQHELLTNRLLWLGVALCVLTLMLLRFRFAYDTGSRGGHRAAATNDDAPAMRWTGVTVPAARRTFGWRTRLRQLRLVAFDSFRALHRSRGWWVVPFICFIFVTTAAEILELDLGVPGAATTARVASIFAATEMTRLVAIMIALSAGELIWRERDARMNAIADVTPVPEWLSFLGRYLGLALMLAATEGIFVACGVLVQMMLGAPHIELDLYAQLLFGAQYSGYLIFAALAMIIHAVVNQKYVGNVVAILVYIALEMAREFGVEHHLLLYGTAPELSYSQISGFGLQWEPWRWLTLYWSGWALLFAVATYLLWIRGEESGLRMRLALARRRLTGGAAALVAVALTIIIGAGGYVFYNTNVLNRYYTDAERDERRVEYERRYGKYAAVAQPLLAQTKLQVDFHPERAAATIRGQYLLENRGTTAIDAIHVVVSPNVATEGISFDRPSRVTLRDDDYGYRIYSLGKTVQPGESVQMNFEVVHAPRGFTNSGWNPSVTGNGSWFQHRAAQTHGTRQWLPFVGYQSNRELQNAGARKRYGLRERDSIPKLENIAARHDQRGHEKLILETIVSTSADQTGVAPGVLRRTWTENGRRYFHYLTDAPITNGYAIYSANYATRRARWRDVDIEILHHPEHTQNLDRIVRSATASLDYHTRQYGPYPHKILRVVEYPSEGHQLGLTSFPGMVEYSEGFGLVRVEADDRKIDFPFAVMAHEMGHQWWGHQVLPAGVEGAPLLSESLAWYSAMLVVEQTHGREHAGRILDMMRAEYMGPHETRDVPLLRSWDHLDAYRTGPFAMYALREQIGVERVNGALRSLIAKFDPSRTPLPTSLDLYAELRAATPPERHSLLRDLFEEITYWDLRAKKATAQPQGGAYRVTLEVEAQKLKGNAAGKEKPAPMNDFVEVVLFDAKGAVLYRQPHRMQSGVQTITLTVPRKPARVGLDPDHELLDRTPANNEAEIAGS